MSLVRDAASSTGETRRTVALKRSPGYAWRLTSALRPVCSPAISRSGMRTLISRSLIADTVAILVPGLTVEPTDSGIREMVPDIGA